MNNRVIEKFTIVMRYLEMGGTLIATEQGHKLILINSEDQLGLAWKMIKMTPHIPGASEVHIMGCDWTFNQILHIVDQISDEQYARIATCAVLNDCEGKEYGLA